MPIKRRPILANFTTFSSNYNVCCAPLVCVLPALHECRPMFDLESKKALQLLCHKEQEPMVITRALLGMLDFPEPLAYGLRMLGNFALQSDQNKEIIVDNKVG